MFQLHKYRVLRGAWSIEGIFWDDIAPPKSGVHTVNTSPRFRCTLEGTVKKGLVRLKYGIRGSVRELVYVEKDGKIPPIVFVITDSKGREVLRRKGGLGGCSIFSCVWDARIGVPAGRYTARVEFDTGPFEGDKAPPFTFELE